MHDRISRWALIAAVLAAFGATFLLTRATGRGQLAPPARSSTPLPRASAQPASPPILPLRDPFEVPPGEPLDAPSPTVGATPHALPTLHAVAPPLHLLALVTGAQPSAIVDDGSGPHVVGIGDRVGALFVVAIDAGSLELSDGRRLVLGHDAGAPR